MRVSARTRGTAKIVLILAALFLLGYWTGQAPEVPVAPDTQAGER